MRRRSPFECSSVCDRSRPSTDSDSCLLEDLLQGGVRADERQVADVDVLDAAIEEGRQRARADVHRRRAGRELLGSASTGTGRKCDRAPSVRRVRAAVVEDARTGPGACGLAAWPRSSKLDLARWWCDTTCAEVELGRVVRREQEVDLSSRRRGAGWPTRRGRALAAARGWAWRSCHACGTQRGAPTETSPPSTTSDGKPCSTARSA